MWTLNYIYFLNNYFWLKICNNNFNFSYNIYKFVFLIQNWSGYIDNNSIYKTLIIIQ